MTRATCFGRFLALALAVTLLLALVGYLPTQRQIGSAALGVVAAGCGASLIASVCGACMLMVQGQVSPERVGPAIMRAMLVRLLVTAAVVALLLTSDMVPVGPLLLWVASSYVVLLAVDTHFAVKMVGTDMRRTTDRRG